MSIIIQQPYAHLEKELTQTFKGQEDVQVIVGRRYAERRKLFSNSKKEFISPTTAIAV